jgi:lipid A ethanolaminephosphotransferase
MIFRPEAVETAFSYPDLRKKLFGILAALRHPGINTVIFGAALFMAVFDNRPLWQAIWKIVPPLSVANATLLASCFIVVVLIFVSLLSLFGVGYLLKPVLATILIIAAAIGYFMSNYGIVIDRSMIQNLFETDLREATELLNPGLFWHILGFGVIPAGLVLRTDIRNQTFPRELGRRVLTIVICLLIIGTTTFASYKDLSLIIRQNRHLRFLVNPIYPVYALATYAKRAFSDNSRQPLQPIAAVIAPAAAGRENDKKRVVVFVLGETARAANFSLNGYPRETNPMLREQDILNFSDTQSCATSTADALPCIFSGMTRENYDIDEAKQRENLLDLLTRAGIRVLWRDNNSGSKGIADRVASEDSTNLQSDGFCRDGECFDEILLRNLREIIDQSAGDLFLVLHQKGSHGPLYYRRVPDNFRKFTPECRQDDVQKCSREEIVNSYDNTILYTDYFLAKTIDLLRSSADRADTALIYMSDHGESLGENVIYLHGAPYIIAPDEQTHIPFISWLSEGFVEDAGIDLKLLRSRVDAEYSHDNLFHTVLGLFSVKTEIYRSELDIFASRRKS